jgi:NAD(P)-dependent dehydrogenase (short-subunit alcohol dehydrogenase family)
MARNFSGTDSVKQCLITGAGTRFGRELTLTLCESGYHVHLVTSAGDEWKSAENVTVINVDWQKIDIKNIRALLPDSTHLDLIFFNHNSSALSKMKFEKSSIQRVQDWQHSYFVACQLPYYLIHSLQRQIHSNTKIVWMLSRLIQHVEDSEVGHADYIGNKFTNACIMRAFSRSYPACFFGMHPDDLVDQSDFKAKAQGMVELINNKSVQDLNGNIFSSTGEILDLYE